MLEDYKKNKMNFYDVNAKSPHYNISEKDKLFVSFFTGRDNMGLDDLVSMKWGSQTSNIRWFHQFSDRHYFNTSLYQSGYMSDNWIDALDKNYTIEGNIRQVGLKQYFSAAPSPRHEIKIRLPDGTYRPKIGGVEFQ